MLFSVARTPREPGWSLDAVIEGGVDELAGGEAVAGDEGGEKVLDEEFGVHGWSFNRKWTRR